MLKQSLIWSLTLILVFNSGCIHTPTVEHKMVQSAAPSVYNEFQAGELTTASVVYLPSKLPLEDFFARLSYGEFSTAFKKIDLNYRSSNTSDSVLRELIHSGIVPVYVQVENRGKTTVYVSERNFVLTDGIARVRAIQSGDVPTELSKFSPEAFAANTFNVGVVVVGMAALVTAFILVASNCQGGCNLNGFTNLDFHGSGSSSSSGDADNSEILNDLTKTVVIDYNAYLLNSRPLAPGEKAEGLVLFHMKRGAGWNEFHLALAEGGLL